MKSAIKIETYVTPPTGGDGWRVDVEVASGRHGRIGSAVDDNVGDAFSEALMRAMAYESVPREDA